MTEDIYIRFLRNYYTENGTVNNIPSGYIVEFEGKTLNIYSFLNNIKTRHKAYINGTTRPGAMSPSSICRYRALDEMGFNWNDQRVKRGEDVAEEPVIRFLRQHYREHGTINNIPIDTVIEFEGEVLRVGNFLKTIRAKHADYEKGKSKRSCCSSTSVLRYRILEEMGIEWNNRCKKTEEIVEEPAIRYLKSYYAEYGTINDISTNAVVVFEGMELKIGSYLKNIREKHGYYVEGLAKRASFSETSITRYSILDELGIEWTPERVKASSGGTDLFIEFLENYYQEHGTINDIPSSLVVEYNGERLRVGDFLIKMRYSYNCYKDGNASRSYGSKLMLKRYETLTEMGFIWGQKELNGVSVAAAENGLAISTLSELNKKFNGDMDKAVKFALLSKRKREERKNLVDDRLSLGSILKEFDIDLEALTRCLNRDNLRTGEAKSKLMYDSNMSLHEFCIQNGYNYRVISKAVRLRMNGLSDDNLDSLINRCVVEYRVKGQNKPATWIYSKYGNELLVKHLLLLIGFDSTNILRDMTNNAISLDEAFENESFRRNRQQKFGYLETVYHDFVSFYRLVNSSDDYTPETASTAFIEYAESLVLEYHLSQEEFGVIKNAFNQYVAACQQYRLFDVAFEKDIDKKVMKIIDYDLDSDDIEEAFFLPLKFDERVLIGRDSEMYRRRVLLKNLTVSWNDLSVEERDDKILKHGLSSEELYYVTSTRQSIDEVKNKVYKLS